MEDTQIKLENPSGEPDTSLSSFLEVKIETPNSPLFETSFIKTKNKVFKYKCPICYKKYKTKERVKRHVNAHITIQSMYTNDYNCPNCSLYCGNSVNLLEHVETHKKLRGRPRKDTNRGVVDIKPFICEICAKGFKVKQQLLTHSTVHIDIKPFQCWFCGKSFKLKHQLQNHLKIHYDEKPFMCELCEKSFRFKQQLENHLKSHSDIRPFQCTYCGKAFKFKQQLQIHSRVHNDFRPFQCEFCSKAFKLKQQLQFHFKIHTDEKPFDCSVCQKAFRFKQQLQTHLRIHTKYLINSFLDASMANDEMLQICSVKNPSLENNTTELVDVIPSVINKFANEKILQMHLGKNGFMKENEAKMDEYLASNDKIINEDMLEIRLQDSVSLVGNIENFDTFSDDSSAAKQNFFSKELYIKISDKIPAIRDTMVSVGPGKNRINSENLTAVETGCFEINKQKIDEDSKFDANNRITLEENVPKIYDDQNDHSPSINGSKNKDIIGIYSSNECLANNNKVVDILTVSSSENSLTGETKPKMDSVDPAVNDPFLFKEIAQIHSTDVPVVNTFFHEKMSQIHLLRDDPVKMDEVIATSLPAITNAAMCKELLQTLSVKNGVKMDKQATINLGKLAVNHNSANQEKLENSSIKVENYEYTTIVPIDLTLIKDHYS